METVFDYRRYAHKGYVLLADDDEDDRSQMHHFFREHGFPAYFVTSGKAVLEYISSLLPQNYPAVIVLDYNMPGLSGEDTLRQLKQSEWWHIPVVIYSSHMPEALHQRLLSHGAFGCFAKTHDHDGYHPLTTSLSLLLNYCAELA